MRLWLTRMQVQLSKATARLSFLYFSNLVLEMCACQIVSQTFTDLLCLGLGRPHCQEGLRLSVKMRHGCSLESDPSMMPSFGMRGRQYHVD